nr:papain-like protease and mycoviral RNase III domain-containing protein [Fusarium asiaticum vivivirus 1]
MNEHKTSTVGMGVGGVGVAGVEGVVGASKYVGGSDDWLDGILGQKVFGRKCDAYVSTAGGVSSPHVRVPPIPKGAGMREMASVFRLASGVASRGGYLVLSNRNADSVSREEEVKAVEPGPYGSTPVGRQLNILDAAVRMRDGNSGRDVANGECYTDVYKEEYHDVARATLGAFPYFSEVMSVPNHWFASSEDLRKVGVSLQNGVIHFQKGKSQGVLSAHDLLLVSKRMDSRSVEVADSLLGTKVGGYQDVGASTSSFGKTSVAPPVAARKDCRRDFLALCDLSSAAVFGRTLFELKRSPGWKSIEKYIKGEGAVVYSKARMRCCDGIEVGYAEMLGDRNFIMCDCWHKLDVAEGHVVCHDCGMVVKRGAHASSCGDAAMSKETMGVVDGKVWLGEALHTFDVRRELLSKLDHDKALNIEKRLLSQKSQAAYLAERGDDYGDEHVASMVFKGNYMYYREDYVSWLNRTLSHVLLDTCVKPDQLDARIGEFAGVAKLAGRDAAVAAVSDALAGRLNIVDGSGGRAVTPSSSSGESVESGICSCKAKGGTDNDDVVDRLVCDVHRDYRYALELFSDGSLKTWFSKFQEDYLSREEVRPVLREYHSVFGNCVPTEGGGLDMEDFKEIVVDVVDDIEGWKALAVMLRAREVAQLGRKKLIPYMMRVLA